MTWGFSQGQREPERTLVIHLYSFSSVIPALASLREPPMPTARSDLCVPVPASQSASATDPCPCETKSSVRTGACLGHTLCHSRWTGKEGEGLLVCFKGTEMRTCEMPRHSTLQVEERRKRGDWGLCRGSGVMRGFGLVSLGVRAGWPSAPHRPENTLLG